MDSSTWNQAATACGVTFSKEDMVCPLENEAVPPPHFD
jgi:hypothetical protein